MAWKGIIEEYRSYLPVTEKTPVITLLEGNTPLIPSKTLSDMVAGVRRSFLNMKVSIQRPHLKIVV